MAKQNQYHNLAKIFFLDKDIIRFNDRFYFYKDGVWRLETDENTKAWIKTEFFKIYEEPLSVSGIKEILSDIEMFTNNKYREQIRDLLAVDNSRTLNTNSGILDLHTMTTTPYSKEAFCFHKLAYDYNEDYACEAMYNFLDSSVWGKDIPENEDGSIEYERTINFVQEWLGYSLTNNNPYEKALIMVGDGGNGKGVLMNIWKHVLGKYNYSNVDVKYVNDGSQTFMTKNKLINFSNDLENGQQLDTGVIKSAVSGEEVIINEKYKKQETIKFTAKLIIACNELPYIKNSGNSVTRRFYILPFLRIFSEHERDINLFSKLKAESSDIFSWAVEGLLRLRRRGYFVPPRICKISVDEFIKNNDSVLLWLDESGIKENSLNKREKTSEVYTGYLDFCKSSNVRPLGKTKFYTKLEKAGYKRVKINGATYFDNLSLL